MGEDDGWERYGKTLIASMREVLQESAEDAHANLLETADWWLSLGIAIGLNHPAHAERLLVLIESHEDNRAELARDAEAFCEEALP